MIVYHIASVLTANAARMRPVLVPALALLALLGPAMLPGAPARADDAGLQASQGGGRFLRLGLSKSAVIKLPAEAKEVIVGNEAIVDVVLRNRGMAYFFARTTGQTNVFFFDAAGKEILHLDLEVTLDTKALKNLIDRAMPNNKIQVDSTGSNVVLRGMVDDAQQAKTAEDLANRYLAAGASGSNAAVLNMLKVAEGDQVMLKVKVVELKRSVLKELGIEFTGGYSAGKLNVSFNSADGSTATGTQIDAQIRALETNRLATVLAEPTLTAVSGSPASFRAGGEYPYTVCEGNTDNTCNVAFKNYGISLDFTPTVLSEGRIALNVRTEVSELADQVLGRPIIDTRNAQTSVEIPSGGSMMLAGLIKDTNVQTLKGTPGLKSLPFVGALFNSRDLQTTQNELVVIVTPYIVNSVQERQLATPTDGFNMPTDLQQIFLGRLNRVNGASGGGGYYGQVGHIVE